MPLRTVPTGEPHTVIPTGSTFKHPTMYAGEIMVQQSVTDHGETMHGNQLQSKTAECRQLRYRTVTVGFWYSFDLRRCS